MLCTSKISADVAISLQVHSVCQLVWVFQVKTVVVTIGDERPSCRRGRVHLLLTHPAAALLQLRSRYLLFRYGVSFIFRGLTCYRSIKQWFADLDFKIPSLLGQGCWERNDILAQPVTERLTIQ